ncbi:MAG: RES family NAD+ phosphorylase [Pseudomonadota bacterium]
MIKIKWQDEWWNSQSLLERIVWRGVEAQHIVATMKLVDFLEEQQILEEILESSKPPLPLNSKNNHYLLTTPFRYPSMHPSRFRKAHALGIWYGAENLRTACVEVGYWRWRFLIDSDGLRNTELVSQHTFFQAKITGTSIDLSVPPWNELQQYWKSDDYTNCQTIAMEARSRRIQWIRYESVRGPVSHCAAVLSSECLNLHEPQIQQHWICKATQKTVVMLHNMQGKEDQFEMSMPELPT